MRAEQGINTVLKLTTTVAIRMKETEHLLNLAKYRILFHIVIPEINIYTRDYATRENISFRNHSVK